MPFFRILKLFFILTSFDLSEYRFIGHIEVFSGQWQSLWVEQSPEQPLVGFENSCAQFGPSPQIWVRVAHFCAQL